MKAGELGSDAALPEGPYRAASHILAITSRPTWTVTGRDGRAIAGHVPSRAIADAIAGALNVFAGYDPQAGIGKRKPRQQRPQE